MSYLVWCRGKGGKLYDLQSLVFTACLFQLFIPARAASVEVGEVWSLLPWCLFQLSLLVSLVSPVCVTDLCGCLRRTKGVGFAAPGVHFSWPVISEFGKRGKGASLPSLCSARLLVLVFETVGKACLWRCLSCY